MYCGNPAAEAAKGPANFERRTWYLMERAPIQNSAKFSALSTHSACYAGGPDRQLSSLSGRQGDTIPTLPYQPQRETSAMTQDQLEKILEAIDQANSLDPNKEIEQGEGQPRELLYGRRMSRWLARLRADADAALQIAARAQHIRRWEHPREEYPMDRKGYLAWRRGLYTFHAEQVGAIMEAAGVDSTLIERVSFLLHKKQLHDDADTQALEDAACLVFLEHHIGEFAAKTDREKMIGIIRKTWRKMSEQGHEFALKLNFSPEVMALIGEALGDG